MAKYRITHDGELHYPPGQVAKPGDVVTNIPVGSVRWLKAEGLIEEVSEDAPTEAKAPAPAPKEAP